MKNALIFLLVIGVLIGGTMATVEELAKGSIEEFSDFPNFSDGDTPDGVGDPIPNGHGDGDGGIPG